ncbi:MAG: ABC transporter permease [Anaerolineae bacterium]|nr:ABC transporter permease [Anaerolineae bacterium]
MSEMTQKSKTAEILSQALPYVLAVLGAFAAAGVFLYLMGFDVLEAYKTILYTSFKSTNGFVQTLLKFTPLVLMALAFTIPQKAGKFNIGVEGQLILGGVGATVVGILCAELPPWLLIPLVIFAGVVFGGFWALIPAWLLYRFGINEILSTVLMNFISYNLLDFVATKIWRDPMAGHPTTIPISANGFLPKLIQSPPLHSGLIIALVVAAIVYVYTNHTSAGYELVATGANPKAAKVFGIPTKILFLLALVLGGGMAGLAGAIEVAGTHHRLIEGMQSNYQALGIITGLLAKGNHAAVPFVAFALAVLEIGASALQRTMGIPVEMVFIVEAMILIFVLLSDVVRRK